MENSNAYAAREIGKGAGQCTYSRFRLMQQDAERIAEGAWTATPSTLVQQGFDSTPQRKDLFIVEEYATKSLDFIGKWQVEGWV